MEEKINIFGWKGQDKIEVGEDNNNYEVIEHRQEKHSGEIKKNSHIIPKVNVQVVKQIIDQMEQHTTHTSKYLARKLINHYRWHEKEGINEEVFMSALWGGKYRAKYYFPFLYYPLKILEDKRIIYYGGRGQIMRLK